MHAGVLQNELMLKQIKRNNAIEVKSVSIHNIHHTLEQQYCRRNRPLYVMPPNDNISCIALQQLWESIPKAIWLILLDRSFVLEEFFANIHIPFNCEFLVAQQENEVVILTEVYRVSPKNHLRTYHFGNWTSPDGLSWPSSGFYERRRDLHEYEMKAGITLDEMTSRLENTENGEVEFYGYPAHVWRTLEQLLNFKTNYSEALQYLWGVTSQNGTWHGMIGMIARKEVEVGIGTYSMTNSRFSAVDYFVPLLESRSNMYFRTTKENSAYNTFIKPFSSGIWMVLISIMSLLVISLVGFNLIQRRIIKNVDTDTKSMYAMYVVFFEMLGIVCQQGHESKTRSLSSRTVYFVSHLTALVLLVSYSASLISHLTFKIHVPPFTNFEEFLADGTYEFGVQKESFEMDYFNESKNTVLHNIYTRFLEQKDENLPTSRTQGLQRVCSEEKYAFMIAEYTYGDSLTCILEVLRTDYVPFTISMITTKNSPLIGIMNHKLQNMRRVGVLRKLRDMYIGKRMTEERDHWKSTDIYDALPLLVVLTSGIVVAILLLAMEKKLWTFKCGSINYFSKMK